MNKLIIAIFAFVAISCNAKKHFLFEKSSFSMDQNMQAVASLAKQALVFQSIFRNASKTNVQIISSSESTKFGGKYDACLDIVEQIDQNIIEMARTCLNGNWKDTLPMAIDTLEKAYNAFTCFKNATVSSVASDLKIDPQCVIQHLQTVETDLVHFVTAITKGDFNQAQADFKDIIDTLNDIINC